MENLPKFGNYAVALITAQLLLACAMPSKHPSPGVPAIPATNLLIAQLGTGHNAQFILCVEAACPRPTIKHIVQDIGLFSQVHTPSVAMHTISAPVSLPSIPSQRPHHSNTNTEAGRKLRVKRSSHQRASAQTSKALSQHCVPRTQDFQWNESPAVSGSMNPAFPNQATMTNAPVKFSPPIDSQLKGTPK